MIMDCVSSICRTVEAAMINKTIRQIFNSMGPVCVTHQIQLNKENNCLLAKWKVAMSQYHVQLSFAQGTLALDTQLRACPCLMGSCEAEGGWMFAKLFEEPKLHCYDSVFKTSHVFVGASPWLTLLGTCSLPGAQSPCSVKPEIGFEPQTHHFPHSNPVHLTRTVLLGLPSLPVQSFALGVCPSLAESVVV